MGLLSGCYIPENTFAYMHERCTVYTISTDIGQRLEKTCMHQRGAHEVAIFKWICL